MTPIQLRRYSVEENRPLVTVNADDLALLENLANQLMEIQQHEQDAKDLKPVARHTHERLLDTIKFHSK